MLLNFLIRVALVQTVWGVLQSNNHPATTSSPDGTVLHQTLGLLVVELDKRVNDLQNKVAGLEEDRHQYLDKANKLETSLSSERLKVESLQQILQGQNASLASLQLENSLLKNATLQLNFTLSNLIAKHLETTLSAERLEVESLRQILEGQNASLAVLQLDNYLQKNASLQINSTLSRVIADHQDMQANIENLKNVSMPLIDKDFNNMEIQIRRILYHEVSISGNLSNVQNVLHDLHEYVYRKKPAFTAYLDGSFQGSGAIILPHVYSNMGSLYDPTTGIFTVDQAGNYAFYVGLECTGEGLKIVELVKDGNKTAHATCHPKNPGNPDDTGIYYGSTFCVHHLDVGSKVWIKDTRYEHVIVGGKTTLSGFLL